MNTLFDNLVVFAERGPDRLSPFLVPMGIGNVGAGMIAINFGPLGPNFATVSACASSGHGIGEAYETIRRGDALVMIAGGAEAGIHEALVGGFCAMRALSTRNDDPAGASRPFDQGRDGFVVAEGAGVLVLEDLEHARGRGATILAELVGYGATADAFHITLPPPGGIGAVRAARRALQKAGPERRPTSTTSTPTPRRRRKATGPSSRRSGRSSATTRPRVAITANKSMTGHTLGAAGAIEAAITILTLRNGCVPPTINLVDPDEDAAGLDLTPNKARARDLRIGVSNSFGFGGQNTALVFRRWDE